MLAPASPSPPGKKPADVLPSTRSSLERPVVSPSKRNNSSNKVINPYSTTHRKLVDGRPGPTNVVTRPESQLIEGLQALRQESKNQSLIQASKRSTSFLSPAAKSAPFPPESRHSDLSIKVNIPFGPISFQPSSIDPDFLQVEPNSQTRLSKRYISHETVQSHLADRHIVRINELYAIIRKVEAAKFQGGNEWKIPLIGDWVLFGVIGQKSDFKTTNAYVTSQLHRLNDHQTADSQGSIRGTSKPDQEDEPIDELNDQLEAEENSDPAGGTDLKKSHEKSQELKKMQKKFITFKLVDLTSNKISGSGSGVIHLILFESDSSSSNGDESHQKRYRGGSGGAYEKFWKEQPGTLIAILNPKVLKNRPHSNAHHRNKTDILSITPENHHSIIVVGRAKDLGSCVAKRSDTGKECGDWCDLRNCTAEGSSSLSVCEFHLRRQVCKVRASRAEFFAGTSGMKTHTGNKMDMLVESKTGLLPASNQRNRVWINGQATYICGGSRNSNGSSQASHHMRFEDRFRQPIDVEKLEGMKLKRKRDLEEIEMNKILKQEKEEKNNYGYKIVQDAKSFLSKKTNGNQDGQPGCSQDQDSSFAKPPELKLVRKSIYSTSAIRTLGFDPLRPSPAGSSQQGVVHSEPSQANTYDDLLRCDGRRGKSNEEEDDELSSRNREAEVPGGETNHCDRKGDEILDRRKDDRQGPRAGLNPSFKSESHLHLTRQVDLDDYDEEGEDDDDDLIIEPKKT